MTMIEAVRDALMDPHPATSQDRVHTAVARSLEGLAERASIRKTGYFNHSWVPDLVVKASDQAERPLYLRFGVRDSGFSDDLDFLADDHPWFFDLEAANPTRPERAGITEDPFDLSAALDAEADVLVTEADAIDRFESNVRDDRDVKTATEQVVLGGRGLVDVDAAELIVDNWRGAVAAVEEADADELRAALVLLDEHLTRVAALDLESKLRTRWIAAGQPAETFPGSEGWDLSDRAPWEIARLVLSLVDRDEVVPSERWAEITQAIGVSPLGHELYHIGQHRSGGAVNDLAREGLSTWTAQSAYVPSLPSDSLQSFDWAFGGYSVALNLINRVAYFTDIGKKWSRVPRASQLPSARARLETLNSDVVKGVGLTTPEEDVQHALRPNASMSLAQRLEQFLGDAGDTAWRAARLTALDLVVPGIGATISVDFKRDVVTASEPVPLRDLAFLCAEYVAGLGEDDMAALRASFEAEA